VNEEDSGECEPVTGWGVASYLFFALLILWLSHSEGHWVFLLDNANLALHEAGHPALSLISDRLTVYGGTLMQLVFPLSAGFHFYRRGEALSVAFAVLWLGENLFNIAVYMADARVQILPLVGNGEHDWTEIFSRWGVLDWDTGIAALVRVSGWLLIIAAGVWLGYRHRNA
jgi:hypothetical protein